MAEPRPDLGAEIDFQIREGGPISIETYMALCLTHPSKGYYRKGAPLGATGDFITAPEISQMFGEMIGAFLADLYGQMGRPGAFTVLELGPGRGTLAADMLRVATRDRGLADALTLALYETHPDLAATQRETLAAYHPRHIADFGTLPDAPLVVIANEFFDALPIRQYVRRGGRWHERRVGLSDGKRVFGLDPTPVPSGAVPEAFASAPDGAVAEIGLAAETMMKSLARFVAPRGGALLAIDYGHARTAPGETLQAVQNHRFADPLDSPGRADLSSHVDFEALQCAARKAGLRTPPLVTQGAFLSSLGIATRARALADANPGRAEEIAAAHDRLVADAAMGRLFKAMVAASPGLVPAGFPPPND